MKGISLVCMTALLIIWPCAIEGQQRQGQIKGRVADTAGNPISNLTLIVRNTTTARD